MENLNPIDISVIVPVYNTGEFIATCLDSIISQEGVNLEIIIVNDGSTDNSYEIIKPYLEKFDNIRYVYQQNQGLSVARNTGLQYACGEFILFVDSDDWILPGSLSYYINKAHERNVDVVIGKVDIYYDNGIVGQWSCIEDLHQNQPITSGADYLNHVAQSGKFAPMVYTYFCRRTMLEQYHLTFEPGLIHEDELWTPHMLIKARTVTFGSMPHYAYRRRTSGSITSSTTQQNRLQSLRKIVSIMSETYCTMDSNSPAYQFFKLDIRAIYRTCAQIALRNNEQIRMMFEEMHSSLNDFVKNDKIINLLWNQYNTILQPHDALNVRSV